MKKSLKTTSARLSAILAQRVSLNGFVVKTDGSNRCRFQVKWWLNLCDPFEYDLAQKVGELTQSRQLAGTLRDALRLILDLRAGRTDVLLELFPWVLNSAAPQSPMETRLAQLEALMLRQGNTIIPLEPRLSAGDTVPLTPISAEEIGRNFAAGMDWFS